MDTKKHLRREVLELIKTFSDEKRAIYSRQAGDKLLDFLANRYQHQITLGVFMSMPSEIDTSYFIRRIGENYPERFRLAIPRVEDEVTINFYPLEPSATLLISKYGIGEPLVPEDKAVIPEVLIMPGVVFDTKGGRIGRGKGYYDRYVNRIKSTLIELVVLCYDEQVLNRRLPMEEHDYPMDYIVTPSLLIDCDVSDES